MDKHQFQPISGRLRRQRVFPHYCDLVTASRLPKHFLINEKLIKILRVNINLDWLQFELLSGQKSSLKLKQMDPSVSGYCDRSVYHLYSSQNTGKSCCRLMRMLQVQSQIQAWPHSSNGSPLPWKLVAVSDSVAIHHKHKLGH